MIEAASVKELKRKQMVECYSIDMTCANESAWLNADLFGVQMGANI